MQQQHSCHTHCLQSPTSKAAYSQVCTWHPQAHHRATCGHPRPTTTDTRWYYTTKSVSWHSMMMARTARPCVGAHHLAMPTHDRQPRKRNTSRKIHTLILGTPPSHACPWLTASHSQHAAQASHKLGAYDTDSGVQLVGKDCSQETGHSKPHNKHSILVYDSYKYAVVWECCNPTFRVAAHHSIPLDKHIHRCNRPTWC